MPRELNKIDRKLEERSHLTFEFPQTNNRVFRTFLPFLENPKVSERGRANLNEYNLIGRAGSLFSYGGANSREINLTFKISLLNLLHLDATEGISEKFKRSFNLFFSDRERDSQRFALTKQPSPQISSSQIIPPEGAYTVLSTQASDDAVNELNALNNQEKLRELSVEGDVKIGKGFPHAETHRTFYRELVGQVIGGDPIFDNVANILIEDINEIPTPNTEELIGAQRTPDQVPISSSREVESRVNNLIDLIYVWINLVRSSVMNNAENTVQGPPIIRLTHGPMFNNVPCVAEDYTIRIMDESGFDVQTLTPKQLEVTLSLRELRTGDFSKFEQGTLEAGDTLAGWEAILRDNNTDPYNGIIKNDQERK